MINCHITASNPLSHLLNIELTFDVEREDFIDFFIPSWRPGRYETAPFSKNIHDFQAFDQNQSPLPWSKSAPNAWRIALNTTTQVSLKYSYYANKMDAGNSVLDDSQWYINFINCIFYTHRHEDDEIQVTLDYPSTYKWVTSLVERDNGLLIAKNYQELVDSPFLASEDINQIHYEVGACTFTIAINGECPISLDDLAIHFQKFTKAQIRAMGEFPSLRFLFILQSLPYKHYHGVEHQNSTVLILGPNDKTNKSQYLEQLLGVASHELFHAWNVTRIRPKEMSPYNFDKETITKTGFVTEGFTTYFGDYFLKTGGNFTQDEYLKELNTLLKRHFENYGRMKSSLITSSENLWINGYQNSVPSNKVSIYIKGALCALILDLTIRKNTQNQKSLINVMKDMHSKFTWAKGGYTKEDVFSLLKNYGSEKEMSTLLHTLYESTEDLSTLLIEVLDDVGLILTPMLHTNKITASFGIKVMNHKIIEIAPSSPAYTQLSIGDELLSINGENERLETGIKDGTNTFVVLRRAQQVSIELEKNALNYFSSYTVGVHRHANTKQRQNLSLWVENND